MPQLGPLEILVIFVVALLVFGPSKLPEIGRQVGKGVNEFRKFQQTLRADFDGMLGHHDDQSDAAADAPTLPPKDVIDVDTPPERAADTPPESAADNPPEGAPGSVPQSAAGAGDPMLPLPWPDAPPPPPPPPPPPGDTSPADRTP
jgi:TatA/E family protein of Tat protein translocase